MSRLSERKEREMSHGRHLRIGSAPDWPGEHSLPEGLRWTRTDLGRDVRTGQHRADRGRHRRAARSRLLAALGLALLLLAIR
jgi:hypothetical protein